MVSSCGLARKKSCLRKQGVSGKMQAFCNGALLYGFLAMAAYTDGKKGVIPVWLTGGAFGLGLCLSWWDGWSGTVGYLVRFLLFAAPFFLLWLGRVMGSADWKLFGIIGAVRGGMPAVSIIFCTLLFAGVFALVKMLITGRLQKRMQLFVWYCKRCMAGRVWYQYPAVLRQEDTIHLGIFALIGALAAGIVAWWMG